jgi:pSer/pThr/pTyr-binding forkhead associated (FHA) protein
MPRLIVRSSDTGPITYELVEDLTTIGRAPDNAIVLDDSSVSGRHAQLQREGELYRLQDLNSTNGTRVNGETINEIALRIGDRLRFGKVEAHFAADRTGDTQPLPEVQVIESKPAASSARPVDFANASPFPQRKKEKDPVRNVALAAVAVAFIALLGSLLAILMMRAPLL